MSAEEFIEVKLALIVVKTALCALQMSIGIVIGIFIARR